MKVPIIKYLGAYVQEDSCDYLFRQGGRSKIGKLGISKQGG